MRLKDISTLSPQYTGQDIYDTVSFVPMESLRNGNIDLKEIPFHEAKGKYTFFAEGDLLIAKVTPCFENGNIAIATGLKEGIGFGTSEAFVLRMNKKALNTFMFYYVQCSKFQDAACATMCGVGGLKRISPLFMRTYELDLPSLPEQTRIVSYLDEKTGAIDHNIAVLTKERDAYQRLKGSIINHAVTRGITPNVPLKHSGLDWLGMVPEHWEVKRLKDVCCFISRGSTPSYVDESPYKVMNQATFSKGYLDESKIRFTSIASSESQIKKGDLLIASTGGGVLGKTYFFDIDDNSFYADTHVTIIRCKEESHRTKFLYYYFSTRYDEINATMVKGSTNQTELQRNNLLSYELGLPPRDEQQQIISYLDTKCAEIDGNIANIDRQIEAYKRLRHAIINEVTTGKRKV